MNFDQVILDLREIRTEVDLRFGREAGEIRDPLLRGMAEGEIADSACLALLEEWEDRGHRIGDQLDAPMRQHRPFRETCGAGRVDQECDIVHLHGSKTRIEVCIAHGEAPVFERVEGDHARVVRAQVVHGDDVLDRALTIGDLEVFAQLRLVVADDDLRLGIADDVGHLLWQKRSV